MRLLKSDNVGHAVHKRFKNTIESIQGKDNITPFELVDKIYKTVDFYYKKCVEPLSVCSRGCAWCCRIPVDVSAVEVQYIYEKTGIEAKEIQEQKRFYPDKSKCPFLKFNECSIYEARPLHCRVFATIDDPLFCIDSSKSHLIYTTKSNNGVVILNNILIEASQSYSGAVVADVRQWFGDNEEVG
jgi:Fe-S-cluster containining protein